MVNLEFWKMHGLGNDYVVFDDRNGAVQRRDPSSLAKKLCRRRFSVGADGLLLLCNPTAEGADLKMRIFNKDGSEAEMCGNGIRCIAKFAYEKGVLRKESLIVETKAGLKKVWLKLKGGGVEEVKVDMGRPSFDRGAIPMLGEGAPVNEKINVGGKVFEATCLSIGNPHCVIFVDDLERFPVGEVGPKIETHPLFPNRVNVEFVEVLRKDLLNVRVWERGCGETLACGTGACASAAAGKLTGKTWDKVNVKLRGGALRIEMGGWRVLMAGPAAKAFEGKVEI